MEKILRVFFVIVAIIFLAATALGLDIIIPFSTSHLVYVQKHGKGVLFLIAAINIFIGSALSAGILSKDLLVGFRQWFLKPRDNGEWNATYGFAIFVTAINILWIILIEP